MNPVIVESALRPDPELASIASWPELEATHEPPRSRLPQPPPARPTCHRQPPAIVPALLGQRRRQQHYQATSWCSHKHAACFAVSTVLIGSCAVTLNAWVAHPLIPFRWRSPEWCAGWLQAAVANAFGSNLCFCVIVLGTEQKRFRALCWCLLLAAGGPPALYLLRWLLQHGHVSLQRHADGPASHAEVRATQRKARASSSVRANRHALPTV